VSCSKDAYEEVLSYDKNSIKVVVLNSTAIKKEKPLFTKISKLNQNLSSLNSQEKNISSGVYNFSIDTEYCKMITLDSIRTYTFNVIREPSNDDFENLVIKKLPNGSLITKLYKYNVTPLEKHNILHGIDVDMTNKIEVSDINDTEFTGNIFGKVYYSGSLCYQAEMVMTSGTSCKGDDHHAYGDLSCPFINSPYMQAQAPTLSVVYVPIDCGGAGTGSGTTGTGNTGGGVSSGHGIVTSPIVPTISFEESMFKEFKKKSLTTAQNNWLTTQNENVVASILNYLSLNDFNTSSSNKIKNLINYLILNPNVSYAQYVNWFMTTSEGKDFSYNQSYWENQSLNFPSQNLPTYNAFFNAYPKNPNGSWMEGANNVYSYVGGAVQQARITYPNDTNNTCALKVSIALNGAGVTIPNIPGQTLQGGGQFANQYFFLNARALNKWMRKTFGTTTNPNYVNIPASQITPNGANLPSLLSNIQGIYSLVCPLGSTWASGHADIINNALCAAGCHFNDAPIEYIDIWKLN
jgi:hypothetical protein